MIPEKFHYGMGQKVYENRAQVLKAAFEKNPLRFKGKIPTPPTLPDKVWINKPKIEKKSISIA